MWLLLFKKDERSQNSSDSRLAPLINVCGRETVNALGKWMLRKKLKCFKGRRGDVLGFYHYSLEKERVIVSLNQFAPIWVKN